MMNLRSSRELLASGDDGVGIIGLVGIDLSDAFGDRFAGRVFRTCFLERGEIAIEIALADGFEPAERDIDLLGHFQHLAELFGAESEFAVGSCFL